jgi:hypothetical protein
VPNVITYNSLITACAQVRVRAVACVLLVCCECCLVSCKELLGFLCLAV